jgi:hypothetical protein
MYNYLPKNKKFIIIKKNFGNRPEDGIKRKWDLK